MPRELMMSLLLWALLAVGPLTQTAAQAQEITLTLRTDQTTYLVGSQATVTLTLDATPAMTVRIGRYDALGCGWNILVLDATGTAVFNGGERRGERMVMCPDVASVKHIPPPLVKQATIPLHNNLQAGDPLPPGHYVVRGLLWWQKRTAPQDCGPPIQGCEPRSAEAVIEITR